jgi:hypothetical protein
MISILVKSDNSAPVKIKLSDSQQPAMYRVEINRRRQNKAGQRESIYSQEDVLGMICDALEWDIERIDFEPEPPVKIPRGTRVVAVSLDDDLMPRRRKTSTVSKPFLDFRGVWRVFVLGEDKAVELSKVVVE